MLSSSLRSCHKLFLLSSTFPNFSSFHLQSFQFICQSETWRTLKLVGLPPPSEKLDLKFHFFFLVLSDLDSPKCYFNLKSEPIAFIWDWHNENLVMCNIHRSYLEPLGWHLRNIFYNCRECSPVPSCKFKQFNMVSEQETLSSILVSSILPPNLRSHMLGLTY